MVERRIEGLEGEREDPRRHVEPPLGNERGVGDEARGGRRAVDQAHHVLQRGPGCFGEAHEEMAQRQDLAGAALAHRRDRGHLVRVQHGGDALGDLRRDGGVAFHEVGEPREHDGADDPVGQRIAPRCRDPRRRHAGPPLALLGRQRLAGELARTGRHAIDRDIRVMREDALQPLPASRHGCERPCAELDPFALPGHAPGGVEREIGASINEHRHGRTRCGVKRGEPGGRPPGAGLTLPSGALFLRAGLG